MGNSETINVNEFLIGVHKRIMNYESLILIFLLALFKMLASGQ